MQKGKEVVKKEPRKNYKLSISLEKLQDQLSGKDVYAFMQENPKRAYTFPGLLCHIHSVKPESFYGKPFAKFAPGVTKLWGKTYTQLKSLLVEKKIRCVKQGRAKWYCLSNASLA